MKRLLSTLILALVCLLPPLLPSARADGIIWPEIELQTVAGGFERPTYITHAGDGSGRLFVVEQEGRIRILKSGVILTAPFLDISDRVRCCGERGLLSLAFPPGYPAKGYFYVNYTDDQGATTISRFHIQGQNKADPASEEILLTIGQPFSNHNGGQLAFGPGDGYLYIGTGDGGSGGDPMNNGQRGNTLLGKILRIDVEGDATPYAIPASNPYTNTEGYRGEIWALGLRNPWRFSFDRHSGDLYIGDVGQGAWEEIDFQPAASTGGENYGWRIMEGAHCYNADECDSTGLVLPVAEYSHDRGCSVTGGYVYRGAEQPFLAGMYFFADYCSGRLWGLARSGPDWQSEELLHLGFQPATFGEDEAGELYIASLSGGVLYRFAVRRPLWLPLIRRGLG